MTGVTPLPGQPGPPSTAWDTPPRRRPAPTSPMLAVDGFEGPLDWLLELARARKIDLTRLSILALVEAFAEAMDAALNHAPQTHAPETAVPDLAQWAAWTVMASHLAELRSRLLLPADVPEARTAQAEAEAWRQQWMRRAEMAATVGWLERRPQLGRDVFARGQPHTRRVGRPADAADRLDGGETNEPAAAGERASGAGDVPPLADGDLTDLLRACLVALRLPPLADTDPPRRLPFWSVGEAVARIRRLLDGLPSGMALAAFMPKIVEADPGRRNLHGRAAVASTFVAGLELARSGAVTLQQEQSWQSVQVHRQTSGNGPPSSPAGSIGTGKRPTA